MKYYLTEESLIYILRLLKEKNSDIFISKEKYNEDIVDFVDVDTIGSINDLLTDAKNNIVESINELHTELEDIELKEGPQGPTGPQGPQGPAGADGLTTSIVVNGQTYTHVNGTITLPNYPSIEGLATEEFVTNSIEELREEMVILEEDDLTIDGLIDNTFPSLTTENKTLLGAINELNNNSTKVIDKAAIDEILLDVFGTTIE